MSRAIIARRPSRRRALDPAEAAEMLKAAQADLERTEAAYHAAVHARAQAAHVAHTRAGMTWTAVARHLGGVTGHRVNELVTKYLRAVALGETLGSPPRQQKEQAQ